MINNISRLKSAMTCWEKTFQTYHCYREGSRRSMNLVDGTAFHRGVAVGQATGDWSQALTEAKAGFLEDVLAAGEDPDDFLMLAHWEIVAECIKLYHENWQDTGMQIIQPECTFDVAIPGTEHNDITLHWQELVPNPNTELGGWTLHDRWGMPTPEAILEKRVKRPHYEGRDRGCPCYQPHRLVGRTDGIMAWKGFIWLQEHKTTSILSDQFWKQWYLDYQLTGYVYGVWKATGMLPRGIVLNAIFKPSESQVAAWNSKRKNPTENKSITDYMKYERQLFLREERDLLRFEQQYTIWCDQWEQNILNGSFPMSPISTHCMAYNRVCDFHDICLTHGDSEYADVLSTRKPDYVDEARQTQLTQITGATINA